jgi:hypothetical protein
MDALRATSVPASGNDVSFAGSEVDVVGPHHAVNFRVGTSKYDLQQFSLLQRRYRRRVPWASARYQTRWTVLVVAMRPVAQRLAIHAVQFPRFGPRASLQHHGDR